MTNSFIINTTGVVKRFRTNFALKGLDLKVPKGISGFVGRNGAGKTTTINVLLGLLRANSGEATFFGLDCWRDSYIIKRRLGVMHEVNAYPSSFTGGHFLAHVASIYEISQSKQRIKAVLKDVGLSDAANRSIGTYSAGMLKRLGLAQTLLGDPEFVILDEPTANIDPMGRITMLNHIKKLYKEKGTSFLISTHILSDLEKVCNWLSIVDSGKIVDQGDIKDLAEKYSANTYRIDISNPGLFLEKIHHVECVEKAWIEEGNICCKVQDANVFYNEVLKIATELNLTLKGLQQMHCTIEEIYKATAGANVYEI
ncbi:MAG: ABC transporter ATP-binding protein [Nitrososphaerota archaeon]|nr:ABC transporter ATP-binding protein [Nitrososphaerota archaeon]